MGKLLFVLAVVICALVVGQYYVTANPTVVAYTFEQVRRADIVEAVAVTGNAEPVEVRNVESQSLGVVQEVLVDYNDEVTEGQVLARLSSDIERVQLSQAETQLKAAKAGVRLADATVDTAQAGVRAAEAAVSAARRELERTTTISAKELIQKAKVDSAQDLVNKAEAGLAEALSRVKQAEAAKTQAEDLVEEASVAVHLANLRLEKTELKANMTGIVLNRSIRVGDAVGRPKFSLTQPSSALFEIAKSLDHMRAIVSVNEADYSRVKKGLKATFTVDTYPDEIFEATVVQIRNSPTSDRTAVNYATVLEFENRRDPNTGEWMVRPRSTVSADIEIRKVENVTAVPNAALLYSPENFDLDLPPVGKGEALVWVQAPEGKPQPKVIRMGITDGVWTQVLGGELESGTNVITSEPVVDRSSGFKLPIGN